MFEIVMPQLSDSMDEGKLISWKVKIGQKVAVGDVIAEVESDKAIMEVQSFKNGVVQELDVNEGDVVPVGHVIAKIETQDTASHVTQAPPQPVAKQKKEKHRETEKQTPQKPFIVEHVSHELTSGISPKARAKAAQYGLDTQTIMKKTAQKVLHVNDVQNYMREHFFTPKALQLLDEYGLDISEFSLNHKIDVKEVSTFIAAHETPLPKPLTQMQKAIIANVTDSVQKPVYHLYESLDATLFIANKQYSITAWLIKIFAKVMMTHAAFRSRLKNEMLVTYPNASISLAVADAKNLYMPVVKDANKLSMSEIAKELSKFKTKLQEKTFSTKDMQGSSFGISNLGMLGVERFDAMINKDDAAIVAIGGMQEGRISVTLTADHRLINGYEAALFMQDVKKEAQNPLNFKD